MKGPIAGDARFVRKPGVIPTDLEHEVVLLDPETRLMFSLNATGRFAWQRLDEYTVAQLARALADEFAVSAARAGADLAALLQELLEAGLVREQGDDARD